MRTRAWAAALSVLTAVALSTAAAAYLAGVFMLLLNKASIAQADVTTYYRYWHFYSGAASQTKFLKISLLGASLICYGIPIVIAVAVAAARQKRALHGAARFANRAEIQKSGLFAETGVIVGKYRGRYLMLAGQQFVLLAAPIRSGKTAGYVVPNALNWRDSLVVNDPKQEVFNLTAGFRAAHGQKVYLFNPFAEDYRTSRYNPLGYVRGANYRVGDLIAIGEVFYPSGGKDAFFDDQARNLFLGLGLYLCETPRLPRTIGEMLRQSSGKGQPIQQYLRGIINERNYECDEDGNPLNPRHWAEGDGGLPPLSDECVDSLNRFLSTSDNTRSSILASFNAPLTIWANPIVDAATSSNDFDLREARKERMTVYIGITPDHLQEAGRLVALLFAQLINLNTKELPENNPALKYQCHMLMDEFTAIGKIPIIAKAIPYMAGYNLRLSVIIQSLAQLDSVYGAGDARTVVTNCGLQILYAPREQRDANEYSEMLGYETVRSASTSRQLSGKGGKSMSESDQRRALLLPQEIKEIGTDRQIVILEGAKPIFCEKIRYYADPAFESRIAAPPSVGLLDMDTHRAMVQARTRELTLTDIADGIDISKLALDMSKLVLPPEENASPDDVEKLVSSFFDLIESANCAEDGTSAPPSSTELAALDEEWDDSGGTGPAGPGIGTPNASSHYSNSENDEIIDLGVLT
ncbi:MAG: type IV secretory system conjugative DNA transfer family protein [Azoarcus sp.]|jgi:type IV secretion system protein VirD4|nr:type IV secretory system conjugative DNA transfer family protein [Azoarcus sp.]